MASGGGFFPGKESARAALTYARSRARLLGIPIGGVKKKLLAAQRAGVRTLLIPPDNAPDLRELPEEVRVQLEIVLVLHMDEVLPRVLLPKEQEVIATAISNGSAHETDTNLALTLR